MGHAGNVSLGATASENGGDADLGDHWPAGRRHRKEEGDMTAILLLTSALLLLVSAVCMVWIRVAAADEQRHEWNHPASRTGDGGRR
jgi:hypothetical protein